MAQKLKGGQRALARYLNLRLSTVQAAIQTGRISESIGEDGQIDFVHAAREWKANTDPGKQHRKPSGVVGADPPDASGASFRQARAVRETFNAKLASLNFQTKSGLMVELRQVRDNWFRIGRTLRDALFNLPDRCSAKIASRTCGCVKDFSINSILRDEVRLILEELINAEKRNGLEPTDGKTE